MCNCTSEYLEIPGLVLAHHPGMTVAGPNDFSDCAPLICAPMTTDIPRSRRYINPARHRVRAFGVCIGIGRMTGSTRSSGGLDDRRKRLLFRCWHRGTREMDLILGRFADAEISNLSEAELVQFEYLMDVPDPDLYAALTGKMPPAPDYANRLFDRIKSYQPESDA